MKKIAIYYFPLKQKCIFYVRVESSPRLVKAQQTTNMPSNVVHYQFGFGEDSKFQMKKHEIHLTVLLRVKSYRKLHAPLFVIFNTTFEYVGKYTSSAVITTIGIIYTSMAFTLFDMMYTTDTRPCDSMLGWQFRCTW
jgi:hypothetical protein